MFNLSSRIQNVDFGEARDWASMADGIALRRLAFAIAERATELIGRLAAEHVAGLPELGRVRLVGEIAKLRGDLAVLDLPERLAAKLKVVALMIDAVAPVTLDVHAIVCRSDDVGLGGVLFAGLERHVRHALKGNRSPAVGVTAAVRCCLTNQVRLIARGLVVHE